MDKAPPEPFTPESSKTSEENKHGATHHKTTLKTEILFILHVIFIIILILIAIYAPLLVTVIILAMNRAAFVYFNGCILNKYEKYVAGNPKYNFFQELYYRLTGIVLNKHDGKHVIKIMDYCLLSIVLTVAIISCVAKHHKKSQK